MESKLLSKEQLSAYVNELLNGKGYFIIPQLFLSEEIKEARSLIHQYSSK